MLDVYFLFDHFFVIFSQQQKSLIDLLFAFFQIVLTFVVDRNTDLYENDSFHISSFISPLQTSLLLISAKLLKFQAVFFIFYAFLLNNKYLFFLFPFVIFLVVFPRTHVV